MSHSPVSNPIRIILALTGFLLLLVLVVPIWRIDLDAPQYPEGLNLLIFANRLGGNVDIINGLNHYIGMKTLHTEDFIEFRILPYAISFFALLFVVTAIVRKKKLLYSLLILFVLFGIVAMADFWKWEYDYGHNLDPNAAIIVPGMAYQPPLIGFKQLLNFGAYSIPDTGGWIFIGAGVVLLICVVYDVRSRRKMNKTSIPASSALALLLLIGLSGCDSGPEAIKYGQDNCDYCKMTLSDNRFGAEIITQKGKAYKYDELQCLFSAINENMVERKEVKHIYVTEFCGSRELTDAPKAAYMSSSNLRSPMGGNVAAFTNLDSLDFYMKKMEGEPVTWDILSQ